jgi:PAS domain S-box-containing protein
MTNSMVTESKILDATVLIVDDQKSNILLLEEILHEAGYAHVTSTMDPHAVAALHRKNRYDLILLDLQMPGLDGFEVMQNLKAIETESYIPVLVITAQPAHKLQALQAGAKDFVSKPFDVTEVKTRIHNLLEVRLLHRQLENYNKVLEQTVQERTAELRMSEARFHALTELASDWYWESDENQRFTKVSGPILEMLGIRVDTLLGGTGMLQGPGWNEAERAELEANIAARRPFLDFVFSRANADGSRQYFQVSGEPIFNQSCRFIGYRGIGLEVTGRMRPDESLRRFRTAMDATADAIFLVDRPSMLFVDVNETACHMFGYTREELLALGPSALKTDSRDELERMYDRLIDGDAEIQPREIQLRRKDGSLLPAEVHRQAQRSDAGWLMVLIIRDLSGGKKRGHKRSKARAAAA